MFFLKKYFDQCGIQESGSRLAEDITHSYFGFKVALYPVLSDLVT